jgi:hypothetical protein
VNHLVQILLPLYDGEGEAFPTSHFEQVSALLTERFGGLTAYTRAPAQGLWSDGQESVQRDDVIIYEVMVEHPERDWWTQFRSDMEQLFDQDEVVVRAIPIERL